MKVGDIVIYKAKGRYSNWFFGALARVEKIHLDYAQVRWCHSVEYENGMKPTVSNFPQKCFEVLK
jgi:type VI protein secretion system component Hcp